MSYRSRHVSQVGELLPCGGTTKVVKYTVEYLRNRSWEDLLAERVIIEGNTRFPLGVLTLAFLKNNMNILHAAREVGYRGSNRAVSNNFVKRISKAEVGNILELLVKLMKAGKMPLKCDELLKLRSSRVSKVRLETAREICKRAVEKWNGKTTACSKLGVEPRVLDYWLNK